MSLTWSHICFFCNWNQSSKLKLGLISAALRSRRLSPRGTAPLGWVGCSPASWSKHGTTRCEPRGLYKRRLKQEKVSHQKEHNSLCPPEGAHVRRVGLQLPVTVLHRVRKRDAAGFRQQQAQTAAYDWSAAVYDHSGQWDCSSRVGGDKRVDQAAEPERQVDQWQTAQPGLKRHPVIKQQMELWLFRLHVKDGQTDVTSHHFYNS